MNDKQALDIFEHCLDEMYRNSYPPITWKEIKRKFSYKQETFYDKHEIIERTYKRIRKKYYKKLPFIYIDKFEMFLLDYAPMSHDPGRKQSKL